VYGSVATGYAPAERRLIALYRLALRLPPMRSVLLWIGPGFEVIGHKPESSDARDQKAAGESLEQKKDTMRFGLIGLGAIGQVRRAALGRTPGCSLTAVFDQDPARLRARAANVPAFRTAEAMLASEACEAVIISTPPDSHEALAIAAMESGK